jgi:hypothetical protein
MDITDPPRCERCAGDTTYVGRISLPPQMIYRCDACGHETWLTNSPTPFHRPPAHKPEAQPRQQQQQQQPDKKKEEDGS